MFLFHMKDGKSKMSKILDKLKNADPSMACAMGYTDDNGDPKPRSADQISVAELSCVRMAITDALDPAGSISKAFKDQSFEISTTGTTFSDPPVCDITFSCEGKEYFISLREAASYPEQLASRAKDTQPLKRLLKEQAKFPSTQKLSPSVKEYVMSLKAEIVNLTLQLQAEIDKETV